MNSAQQDTEHKQPVMFLAKTCYFYHEQLPTFQANETWEQKHGPVMLLKCKFRRCVKEKTREEGKGNSTQVTRGYTGIKVFPLLIFQ